MSPPHEPGPGIPARPVAVLVGDVRGSRKLAPDERAALQDRLREILAALEDVLRGTGPAGTGDPGKGNSLPGSTGPGTGTPTPGAGTRNADSDARTGDPGADTPGGGTAGPATGAAPSSAPWGNGSVRKGTGNEEAVPPPLLSRLAITGGDGFQGVFRRPAAIVAVVRAISEGLWPRKVRFGLGWGRLATGVSEHPAEMDGQAFHRAREAIEEARRGRVFLVARGFGNPWDEVLTALHHLAGTVRDTWTANRLAKIRAVRRHLVPPPGLGLGAREGAGPGRPATGGESGEDTRPRSGENAPPPGAPGGGHGEGGSPSGKDSSGREPSRGHGEGGRSRSGEEARGREPAGDADGIRLQLRDLLWLLSLEEGWPAGSADPLSQQPAGEALPPAGTAYAATAAADFAASPRRPADSWFSSLKLFRGAFSRAAEDLGVEPSTVSRSLSGAGFDALTSAEYATVLLLAHLARSGAGPGPAGTAGGAR